MRSGLLPVTLTSFVGRDEELSDLGDSEMFSFWANHARASTAHTDLWGLTGAPGVFTWRAYAPHTKALRRGIAAYPNGGAYLNFTGERAKTGYVPPTVR